MLRFALIALALSASTATVVRAQTYTLTISGAGTGNGTVTAPAVLLQPAINCTITAGIATGRCSGTYSRNTRLVLTALPTGSATFSGWSGICSGTSTDCSIRNENGAIAAVATFAAPVPQCSLTIGTSTGGTAALTSGTATGNCGRSVTLTATAASGYRFGSWTGGSTTNPLTLVLNQTTQTITPSFVQQCTLTLAASPTNGGSAAITAGAATGDCGRSVTVAATPSANFSFTRWSDNVTGATRAVTVNSATQVLTATFTADTPAPTCTLTIGTAAGGSATQTAGTATGACGRSVTLTARADSNYRFDGWSDGATASAYTFILSAPTLTLTPKFVQQCTLTLAVSPADAGTARFTPDASAGDCGRSVVAEALPNANYVFVNWSDQSTSSSRTLAVSQPRQALTATFARVLSVRVVVSGAVGSVQQLRAGRTACETSADDTENICPLNLTGPDTLVAIGSSTSGFTGWSGACSGRAVCAVTGTERDEVRATFIDVPPISADSAAKDLLTSNTLTAEQRDVLDRTGNGDGVYNLGDLIAHLERTGQQVSSLIRKQLSWAPTTAEPSAAPTAQPLRRPRR